MTTDLPLVSIVVPIYNVENYIIRCINSIIKQTYKNIEIICVDDFSLDNSITLLKNLQRDDARIKILFHDKNKGLGGARNTGIKAASGEFICFVDSDDEIAENYVFELLQYIKASSADLVFCDIAFIDNCSLTLTHKKPFHNLDIACDSYDAQADFCSLVDVWPSAWNKIYKTEIIRKNKLCYKENELYEDHAFYYQYLSACTKVCYLPSPLYKYRINRPGQITTQESPRVFEIFSVLSQLKHIFRSILSENSTFRKTYARVCTRLLYERFRTLKSESALRKEFVTKSRIFLRQFKFADIRRNKDYYIPISSKFIPTPIYFCIYSKNSQKYFNEYTLLGIKYKRLKYTEIFKDIGLLNYYIRNGK